MRLAVDATGARIGEDMRRINALTAPVSPVTSGDNYALGIRPNMDVSRVPYRSTGVKGHPPRGNKSAALDWVLLTFNRLPLGPPPKRAISLARTRVPGPIAAPTGDRAGWLLVIERPKPASGSSATASVAPLALARERDTLVRP